MPALDRVGDCGGMAGCKNYLQVASQRIKMVTCLEVLGIIRARFSGFKDRNGCQKD
ncbi:hypothetical protein [Pseudanabaena sp. PCC 6802]|uniref:hypothetical protein n=1 Tax=Pseudanabaena sp. PCC 6802 TaxID=118173 RepID=UPI000347EEE5|nr:hypothetical protein [Pseudanabaena sp. PCC 6802]